MSKADDLKEYLDFELQSAKEGDRLLRNRIDRVLTHLRAYADETGDSDIARLYKALKRIHEEELPHISSILSKCFEKLDLEEDVWHEPSFSEEELPGL